MTLQFIIKSENDPFIYWYFIFSIQVSTWSLNTNITGELILGVLKTYYILKQYFSYINDKKEVYQRTLKGNTQSILLTQHAQMYVSSVGRIMYMHSAPKPVNLGRIFFNSAVK